MATYTANAAAAGTSLFAGAGNITGITMSQPSATTDFNTPFTLVDQAAAPASAAAAAFPAPTLFSAPVHALMPGFKPNVPMTPGLTAPAWPVSLGAMKLTFAKGIFLASCPANVTFTITA